MYIKTLHPKKKQGRVVVITGNGKGETTIAMGMALRAAGHKMKTCIIQFMKGDLYSGEWDGVKHLNGLVELTSTGKGFCGIEGSTFPHCEHSLNAQNAITLVKEKYLTVTSFRIFIFKIRSLSKPGYIFFYPAIDLIFKHFHLDIVKPFRFIFHLEPTDKMTENHIFIQA